MNIDPGSIYPQVSLNIVVSDKKDLPAILTAIRRHNRLIQNDIDKRAAEYQKNGAEALAQFMKENRENSPGVVQWPHSYSIEGYGEEDE